jgi:hypothetical protein
MNDRPRTEVWNHSQQSNMNISQENSESVPFVDTQVSLVALRLRTWKLVLEF